MTSQPCSSAVLLTEPNSQSATQSNSHVTIQQQSHCVTVTKSHSQRVTKPHMYQISTLRGGPLEFLFFVTSSFHPAQPALLKLNFKYFSQVRRRRANLGWQVLCKRLADAGFKPMTSSSRAGHACHYATTLARVHLCAHFLIRSVGRKENGAMKQHLGNRYKNRNTWKVASGQLSCIEARTHPFLGTSNSNPNSSFRKTRCRNRKKIESLLNRE